MISLMVLSAGVLLRSSMKLMKHVRFAMLANLDKKIIKIMIELKLKVHGVMAAEGCTLYALLILLKGFVLLGTQYLIG